VSAREKSAFLEICHVGVTNIEQNKTNRFSRASAHSIAETNMKRGIIILLICSVIILAYFTASKWAIHHKTLTFVDPLRSDRIVTIDLAVRCDREMESIAEMIDLPVAILSHGNTVKNTEYSFLANVFAARGYMVVSIQHDLETDDPRRWARNLSAAACSTTAAFSTSCSPSMN